MAKIGLSLGKVLYITRTGDTDQPSEDKQQQPLHENVPLEQQQQLEEQLEEQLEKQLEKQLEEQQLEQLENQEDLQIEQLKTQLTVKQIELKKQQVQLKQQQKQLKLQMQLLTIEKKPVKPKRSTKPLACLSAELKHRMLELVRRSSPNFELWLREWYFGPVSLRGAEFLLLGDNRNKPGAFVVSEARGRSRKKEFVLSVLTAEQAVDGSASGVLIVKHYRVRAYYGYSIATNCSFASLQNLINYYSTERDDVVRLGRPCAMPLTRHYAKM